MSRKFYFENDKDDMMLPFIFDLPESSLIFVDKMEDIEGMETILRKTVLMGIDTERKPSFKKNTTFPTSIVQLAVRTSISSEVEKVFILDFLQLSLIDKKMAKLNSILKEIFMKESCYKLGQSLKQDLIELRNSYPCMDAFNTVNSVVEMHSLVKALEPEQTQAPSLKKLVGKYLHYNLVKSQQMSNWAKRPLSSAQIHYAACDALVLLRLFDTLRCELDDKEAIIFQNATITESKQENVNRFDIRIVSANIDLYNLKSPLKSPKKRNKLKRKRTPFSPNDNKSIEEKRLNSLRSNKIDECFDGNLPLDVVKKSHLYF